MSLKAATPPDRQRDSPRSFDQTSWVTPLSCVLTAKHDPPDRVSRHRTFLDVGGCKPVPPACPKPSKHVACFPARPIMTIPDSIVTPSRHAGRPKSGSWDLRGSVAVSLTRRTSRNTKMARFAATHLMLGIFDDCCDISVYKSF